MKRSFKKPVVRSSPMKQQKFFFLTKIPRECGGYLQVGKRKNKRILSTKAPIHLVLRSDKAKGSFSFVNHQRAIENLVSRISQKHKVKVYGNAVNWNHLHFVIKILSETSYRNFIRELTKEIVFLITNRTGKKISQFFTVRPYTRLLTWGREFKAALEYQVLNQLEVVGLRPRKQKPAAAGP